MIIDSCQTTYMDHTSSTVHYFISSHMKQTNNQMFQIKNNLWFKCVTPKSQNRPSDRLCMNVEQQRTLRLSWTSVASHEPHRLEPVTNFTSNSSSIFSSCCNTAPLRPFLVSSGSTVWETDIPLLTDMGNWTISKKRSFEAIREP